LDAHFPSRKDKHREDILETFKQVKVNLPLLEAIRQIHAYTKFLKDMCTFKAKSKDDKSQKVVLSEQVSSILKHDPGVPTISCFVGNHKIEGALLGLGFSVKVIPYFVYLELGLGDLKPPNCTLQLANRSVRTLRGRKNDVLIQIDKGRFSVDFVVLDINPSRASKQIPVIFERPFLPTAIGRE